MLQEDVVCASEHDMTDSAGFEKVEIASFTFSTVPLPARKSISVRNFDITNKKLADNDQITTRNAALY